MDPSEWFFLSMALCRAGEIEKAKKFYQKAIDWIETNDRKDVEFSRFRREAVATLGASPLNNSGDIGSGMPNGLDAFAR
jgi:hypothetical protein